MSNFTKNVPLTIWRNPDNKIDSITINVDSTKQCRYVKKVRGECFYDENGYLIYIELYPPRLEPLDVSKEFDSLIGG